jgi:hypothetical protein
MKKSSLIFMVLILGLLMAFMPVAALAAESGPLVVDQLVEKASQIDIFAWIQFIVVIWGVVVVIRKQWREEVTTGKISRMQFIKDHVPLVHGQVQKAASLFKNKNKAVEFIGYMDRLLRAFNMIPIQPEEVEAVQGLGSGYHQEFKMVRDVGDPVPLVLNVPPKLSNASDPAVGD